MCDPDAEKPVEVPITSELDLHTFPPSDIGSLIPEYLREAKAAGISPVRIVHGKGTGTLRTSVHKILAGLPEVESYQLAGAGSGGWGATWVYLKP